MRSITLLGLISAVAGLALSCGSDSNNGIDAPAGGIDSPPGTIDSPPGTIDAAIDSAPGGADAAIGVACGAEVCDPANQECCVDNGGGQTCVDQGNCAGFTLTCDGPEDCMTAGDACCAVGGGGGGGTECRGTGGGCQAELCHVQTDCTTATDQCCPIPTVGYSACFAVCPP
jgi:hypothetical protein